MAYATAASLAERFGEREIIQLTDRDGFGVLDAARAAQVIAEVEAEVDGYLGRRYRLPLATVPPLVTRLVCDLAREALYTDAPTETVTARAATARRILRDIASGVVELGLPSDATPEAVGSGVAVRAGTRIFGDLDY